MSEVIVVRPGTRLWDELGAVRPSEGTSAPLVLPDSLARELGVPLGAVSVGATVSTYLGETEKNLARLVARADPGGAVLLFDEADALFGKRSEVKDAHDRYADLGGVGLTRRDLVDVLRPPRWRVRWPLRRPPDY